MFLQTINFIEIGNRTIKEEMDYNGMCKTKAIQVDLGIFTHILAYSGIIQAYSGAFVNLAYQNHGILGTRGITPKHPVLN